MRDDVVGKVLSGFAGLFTSLEFNISGPVDPNSGAR